MHISCMMCCFRGCREKWRDPSRLHSAVIGSFRLSILGYVWTAALLRSSWREVVGDEDTTQQEIRLFFFSLSLPILNFFFFKLIERKFNLFSVLVKRMGQPHAMRGVG